MMKLEKSELVNIVTREPKTMQKWRDRVRSISLVTVAFMLPHTSRHAEGIKLEVAEAL